MTFTNPEYLLPGSVAVGAVLLLGIGFRRRARGWLPGLLSLVLRIAALAAVVFFLCGPGHEVSRTQRGSLLVAVDLSRSVVPAERTRIWEALFESAAREGLTLNAVGFGVEPRVLHWGAVSGMTVPILEGGDLDSRPETALALLMLQPQGVPGAGRLVMVTDGALPGPDVRTRPVPALAPLLIAAGGQVEGGVRALGLRASGMTGVSEPLDLTFEIQSGRTAEGHVVVSFGDQEARRVPMAFAPGVVQIPLALANPGPGRHLVRARVEITPSADGGPPEEMADNAAAAAVRIRSAPWVASVCPEEKPLFASALRVQGIEVRETTLVEATALATDIAGPAVIVLDRVPMTELSAQDVRAALTSHLDSGGGVLYLPRPVPGEMYGVAEKPTLDLLPVVGRKPRPAPTPPDEPAVKDPESLKDPDPDARKREKKKAPTLGLVLVIDVSDSMREGGRIRLAKEAAIAAAEVLHEEDLVGVVAFNHEASVVIDLTKARDKAAIRRRIARIRPEGGTVFYKALALVREMLEGEALGIKHVIFLSDGDSHGDRPIRQLITDMAARGITLSTVGCGRTFNASRLSDMALWGRGKFQPAFSAQEIPQVFTIEVERVITKGGARRRVPEDPDAQKNLPDTPRPGRDNESEAQDPPEEKEEKILPVRLALPAPYTRGTGPHKMQGVPALHEVTPRPGAWVAMETEDGAPVLVHGFHGDGKVLAATVPFEGPWARHLQGWEDYQQLAAQMIRFLMPDDVGERFHLLVAAQDRSVTVRVLDRRDRRLPTEGCRLQVRDATGRTARARVERVAEDLWRLALDPADPACGLDFKFTVNGEEGRGFGFTPVSPAPEVRDRGMNLPVLNAWASALGGEVAASLPASLDVAGTTEREQLPYSKGIFAWVLLVLCADLLLKRLVPGRSTR